MDDGRLTNVLFLAGLASLAMPGCSSSAEEGIGPAPRPSGNLIDPDNSLTTGSVEPGDVCALYAAREYGCSETGGGYYGYDFDLGDYIERCEYVLDYLERYWGPGCVQAYGELLACIAEQDCQSFACSAEGFAAETACGQGGGGGTTGFGG